MASEFTILMITFTTVNALINFVLAGFFLWYIYIVQPIEKRSLSLIWFGGITLFTGLWVTAIAHMYIEEVSNIHFGFFYVVRFITPIAIAISVLGLSLSFLWKNALYSRWWKVLIGGSLILMAYGALPEWGAFTYQLGQPVMQYQDHVFRYVYSGYLVTVFGSALYILWRTTQNVAGTDRIMVRNIGYGIGTAIIWGLILNEFLPFLTDGEMSAWGLGTAGVLIMNGIVTYSLIHYQVFNVKPLSVQSLLLGVIVFTGVYFEFIKVIFDIATFEVTRIIFFFIILSIVSLVYNQINRRVSLSKNLDQVSQRLQEQVEEKSKFLQITSHQFRTPLTSITWSQEDLLDSLNEFSSEKEHTIVKKMKIQVDILSDLVADLLSINSLQSGTFELYNQQSLDIKVLIDSIIAQKEYLVEMYHITLKFQKSDKSYPVYGDKTKLEQALTNIIDNAIRYGESSVTISLNQDGEWVWVMVTDDGFGIPQDQQEWVFDKMTRGKLAQTKRPDGSGVGLYLTRMIIDKHQGEISLQSTEGQGSQFTIKLPVDQQVMM